MGTEIKKNDKVAGYTFYFIAAGFAILSFLFYIERMKEVAIACAVLGCAALLLGHRTFRR